MQLNISVPLVSNGPKKRKTIKHLIDEIIPTIHTLTEKYEHNKGGKRNIYRQNKPCKTNTQFIRTKSQTFFIRE